MPWMGGTGEQVTGLRRTLQQSEWAGPATGGVAAILLLYLPFLGVPFEYDDKVEIITNAVLLEPGNLQEMVRYNPFRLLLLISFGWDLWLWKLQPEGYRALNIAIHATNTVLLAQILGQFSRRRGLPQPKLFVAAGALPFAVHPLAIESVTYISGRSSSLATLFVLLSLVLYGRSAELLSRTDATGKWLQEHSRVHSRWVALLLSTVAVGGLPAAALVGAGRITPNSAVSFVIAITGCIGLFHLIRSGHARRALAEIQPNEDAANLGRRAQRLYIAAFVAFVLGCLTKETAATLPAVLLLAEATFWKESWRTTLTTLTGRLLPFFAVPVLLLLLRAAAYGYLASPQFIRPWSVNLLTQVEVVSHYLRLWVIPWPQSIYHEYPMVPLPGRLETWLIAGLLLTLVILAARVRARSPALCFGILAAAVTLLPTSSVFALKETMAEHRTYLPTLGFAFVMAWLVGSALLERLGHRKAWAVLAAVCVGWSILHVRYDLLWRNEETLWRHAVTANPQASDAWRYLGDNYHSQGRLAEARHALTQAVRTRPSNVEALSTLGIVYAKAGDLDRAELLFNQSLVQANCYTPALNNLAFAHRKREDPERAVELFLQSLECDPNNYLAHRGLADIYYESREDWRRASHHYEAALRVVHPLNGDVPLLKRRLLEVTF